MGQRLELQILLEETLGSRNVYYQPPASLKMNYPAIVYKRARAETEYADNNPYRARKKYQLTLIDRNPDSPTFDKMLMLPMCRHDSHFTSDGLNHDVFTITF